MRPGPDALLSQGCVQVILGFWLQAELQLPSLPGQPLAPQIVSGPGVRLGLGLELGLGTGTGLVIVPSLSD